MTRKAFTYSSSCSCYDCKTYRKREGMEIKTPYPRERNKIERFFDRHNHLMEFIRTMFALTTLILQLYIISKLI